MRATSTSARAAPPQTSGRSVAVIHASWTITTTLSEIAKVAAVSEDDGPPDDGKFEVIAVPHTAKWRLLGTALKAAERGLGPQPSVHQYTSINLKRMPIQVDCDVMELGAGAKTRIDIAHQVMQTVL